MFFSFSVAKHFPQYWGTADWTQEVEKTFLNLTQEVETHSTVKIIVFSLQQKIRDHCGNKIPRKLLRTNMPKFVKIKI